MKSCIIKKSFTVKALFPSLLIFALSLIIACVALFIVPFLFAPVILIGAIISVVIAPGNIFTEYEYNIEGELFSVALIKNKSARKELFACDIDHLITCEPYTNQKTSGTVLDFSESINPTYLAVFNEEGKTASVIFSPDKAFVQELFLLSPSKVKRNTM